MSYIATFTDLQNLMHRFITVPTVSSLLFALLLRVLSASLPHSHSECVWALGDEGVGMGMGEQEQYVCDLVFA